jgi:superfamily II DNA or RNA helicase
MFAADRAADDAQRKLDDATRAMAAADERIARMTVESAAHAAAIDQLRKTLGEQTSDLQTARSERDAANQRVAELEALLVREQSRHPRGNMAAIPSVPAAPSAPASSQPVVTTGGPPPSVTNPRTGAGVPTDIYEEHPVALANEIDLAPWQQDALGAWADANHRGVVESVTSEGNTQVAYWAIGRALDNSMKVLVLAPTTERVDKWYDGLRNALPNHRVGKHGGRGGPRMAAFDVVVATAQSAAKEHMFEPGLGVFVVADEVHEFGTDVLSKALDPSYVWRLGLTSSYERDDDGIAMYLDRYFGGALFRLGYDRALAEQAIASFDLALVAVPLSAAERAEYDACAAATLAGGAGGGKAGVRAYLKAIARRDEILSGTTARDSSLRTVAAAIRGAGRGLLVAPSPLVAQHVDRVLAGQSCETTAAGGDGDGRNRRGGKGDDDRDVWQLVTPRDSAETGSAVDLAVMASPPRNRRQLIERMDRILGSQPGGHVRLVVLYVEGSAEDDSLGADAAPIYGVMQHARRLQRFAARDTDALLEFLIAGRRVVELPSDPAADRLNRNADGATATPFS